jgi:hypothetical protein
MSHHASGPEFGFPHGDARLDMTDLYAFPKPGHPGKSIIILNVHPSVGVKPPGPTTTKPFKPGALYEIKIHTDGDTVADLAYSVQVSTSEDGGQTATLRRVQGTQVSGFRDEGEVIVTGVPVSFGQEALLTSAGDYRIFAGWRSDPFFFDADGLFNEMQFTGTDFFADKNVCSIVLELPNSALGGSELGLWARTADRTGDEWIQADRGGRPLQAVFLPGEQRAAYLLAQPADDSQFIGVFAHQLEHAGGYTQADAVSVAKTLLPDVLHYNPDVAASYPANGRTLTDDVVDVFFAMLTGGKVTSDKVGPHADLLGEFPYVGPPHE